MKTASANDLMEMLHVHQIVTNENYVVSGFSGFTEAPNREQPLGSRHDQYLDALRELGSDYYSMEQSARSTKQGKVYFIDTLKVVVDSQGVPLIPDTVWENLIEELTNGYAFKSQPEPTQSKVGFSESAIPSVKKTGFLRNRNELGRFAGGSIQNSVIEKLKEFVYQNWKAIDSNDEAENRTGTLERGLLDASVEYSPKGNEGGFNLFGKYKFLLPDLDRPERPNQPWGGSVPLRFYAPIVFRGRGPIIAKKGNIAGMTFMYKDKLIEGALAVGPAEPKNPFILTGPQISELSKLMGTLVVKEAQ
jgi:hypothetical protein